MNGRTQHFQAKHTGYELQIDNPHNVPMDFRSSSPPSEAMDEDDFGPPVVHMSSPNHFNDVNFQPQLEELTEFFSSSSPPSFHHSLRSSPVQDNEENASTSCHPLINGIYVEFSSDSDPDTMAGKRCNKNGTPIASDSDLPPSPADRSPDDWYPYGNRVGFETAEFLYTRKNLSATDIDFLCQLWAATLAKHGDSPPYANHKDLYETIDSTPIGGVPWQSATFQYDGPRPDNAPTWMEAEYTIWFRDTRLLFKNMLENPEFASHFDYAPHRQYDPKGFRCYENFMSGDWAWKQAVSL